LQTHLLLLCMLKVYKILSQSVDAFESYRGNTEKNYHGYIKPCTGLKKLIPVSEQTTMPQILWNLLICIVE